MKSKKHEANHKHNKTVSNKKCKTYKAHNKSFAGRQFITIDGFSVDLANSDRVEISPSK